MGGVGPYPDQAFAGCDAVIHLAGRAHVRASRGVDEQLEAQAYAEDAKAKNGNEGVTVIDTTPDWMRVRGYASDWAWPDGGMYTFGPQALTLIG